MALSTRARLTYPYSQSLSSGRLHKPFNFNHKRANRKSKNYNTTALITKVTIRNIAKMITWIRAFCNSIKL